MLVKALFVALCTVVAAAGCARRAEAPAPRLHEVVLPDLSRVDAAVQAQVRDAHATLESAVARPDVPVAARAAAFGRVGMLLHAAEYFDAAEPAYLNAEALAPGEPRWPYYLAHLYKSRGETEKSIAAFTRVLAVRPDDVPALVWLGRQHLERGEPSKAERLFERAQAQAPRMVAVLAGLGQAALARKDFGAAVARLEEALALDPSAASLHAPLATAYRARGDSARADVHLARWKNTDILVPDPLRQELDLVLDSGLAFELRGVRALESRDFAAAAGFFRQGAALTPATTALGRSLRHKLATALYLQGDHDAAVEQFEQVVEFAPSSGLDETAAKAHYSLGVLAASSDRGDEAIGHLEAAVRYSPNYVEALQALGDALRRARRDAEALPRYAAILAVDPQAADATFGSVMSLVRLRRYVEAHDLLAAAIDRHPDRDDFKGVMARLLASAPDARVRDGRRAMALVDRLLKGEKTVALGETTAMALAEVGRYEEAAAVQRQVIKAAQEARLAIDLPRMTAALRLYERRQPSRVPWPDDDPIYAPPPPGPFGS